MKKKCIHLVAPIMLITSFFAYAGMAEATQIVVENPREIPTLGEVFSVSVSLDTQGAVINALDGVLTYPSHMTLQDIHDGNSVITFWIDRPHDANGSIHFAGITPGGFAGKGEIFTLVFKAVKSGSEEFHLSLAHALLNDGKGTETALSVSETSGTTTVSSIANDHVSPEGFAPSIAQEPALFGGQHFLTFASQDKDSGIDHYEITESRGLQWFRFRPLAWRVATSPSVLSDQTLHSFIYVKAIDKAGNETLVKLSPTHVTFYENGNAIFVILVLLFALLYVHKKRMVRKI